MTSQEILVSGAEELGVALTADQVARLFRFVAELKKWNKRINLTAITSDRDIVIKHLLDSLSFLKGFETRAGRLLDMGSGAGFPAIPLRIACPDLAVTMVESVKKKASFLRHVLRTLPLDGAEVLDLRTEGVPAIYENTYSLVTARAFADIGSAIAAGARFLAPGGRLVLSRGPEETVSPEAISASRLFHERTVRLRLPHSDYDRAIWVFRKNSKE